MQQRGTLLLLMLASATVIVILLSWQYGSPIPNVTAVGSEAGIGVYWDAAATNSCGSIYWGQLGPRSTKTIVVYLKNERNDALFYLLTTEQWYPANASDLLTLQWDYDGTRVSPDSVRQVSLTLSVRPEIRGVAEFSFYIVIKGSPYVWGDVDHNGIVDIWDVATIAKAYGSSLGSPKWNPDADINGDGSVDIRDITIAVKNVGKTST